MVNPIFGILSNFGVREIVFNVIGLIANDVEIKTNHRLI